MTGNVTQETSACKSPRLKKLVNAATGAALETLAASALNPAAPGYLMLAKEAGKRVFGS